MPKNSTLPVVESTTQSSATSHPILSDNSYGTSPSSQSVQFAHPAPDLPVLNHLAAEAKEFLAHSSFKPEETAIIGAQHLLETTATLMGKFRELGFAVYPTGKCYSTNPGVLKTMQNLGAHVLPGSRPEKLGEYHAASEKDIAAVLNEVEKNPKIKNIIVLDDGGRFYEKIPPHFRRKYRMGGVEQTRAGFYSRNVATARMNIVNVAQSAAKIIFESPFIADATVNEISQITNKLDKDRCVVGIIGFGAIGRALATKLIQDGFSVCVFDKDPTSYENYPLKDKIEILPSIEELFIHTNFIIGSTGQDTTESFDPLSLNGHDRIVVSVSSEDKEYKSFLKAIANKNTILDIDPLSTIRCYTKSGNIIEILYGGFPVNFLNSHKKPFNVPAVRIALTQALLFTAVMQTIEQMEQSNLSEGHAAIPANMMLTPERQQEVVRLWYETTIKDDTLPHELIKKFISDKEFVIAHSKGLYVEVRTQQYKLPMSKL